MDYYLDRYTFITNVGRLVLPSDKHVFSWVLPDYCSEASISFVM